MHITYTTHETRVPSAAWPSRAHAVETRLTRTGTRVPGWSWDLLRALAIHGEMSNGELAEYLDKPAPRVSELVKQLRRAGIVKTRRRGKHQMISKA